MNEVLLWLAFRKSFVCVVPIVPIDTSACAVAVVRPAAATSTTRSIAEMKDSECIGGSLINYVWVGAFAAQTDILIDERTSSCICNCVHSMARACPRVDTTIAPYENPHPIIISAMKTEKQQIGSLLTPFGKKPMILSLIFDHVAAPR
jgi:hypothetical protein